MADKSDIYLELLKEHQEYARHHEEHREKATNIILLIAGGLFTASSLKQPDMLTIPLSFFIVVLGVYGAIISAKHYERSQFHLQRGRALRQELDRMIPDLRLNELKDRADAETQRNFPTLFPLRLFKMWIGIHVIVALGGLSQIVFVAYKLSSPSAAAAAIPAEKKP